MFTSTRSIRASAIELTRDRRHRRLKDIEKTAELTEGGLIVSPNGNNRRAEALRKMLGTAPKPVMNTILITHKPNIIDALGKDWSDVKEGEANSLPQLRDCLGKRFGASGGGLPKPQTITDGRTLTGRQKGPSQNADRGGGFF